MPGETATGAEAAVALRGPVTSVAAVIRERRQASHVAPGFEVEARVALTRTAAADEPETAGGPAEAAAPSHRPPRRPTDPVTLVWSGDPQGGYDLAHDPGWREVESGAAGRTLRLVDHGTLLCQCSITTRRSAEAGPPNAAVVAEDVRRSLGSQFGRAVEASTTPRADGMAGVRVVTAGTVDGVPFRWIHHVVAAPDGRRAELTFMLEEAAAGRFADRDRPLVDRLAFRPGAPGPDGAEN